MIEIYYYGGEEAEQIATYEDGTLEGDERFVKAFGWVEGKDPEELLDIFDGPNTIAQMPQDDSDEAEKESMTSGTPGVGNVSYGGSDDSEEEEDEEGNEWYQKSDVTVEKVDDTFLEAHEKMVQWNVDGSEPLEKAPKMWSGDESLPEFVKRYIREAFSKGAFWSGEFEHIPDSQTDKLKDVFERSLSQPQGWSLSSVVKNIQEAFPSVKQDYAENLARNELAALTNTAREEAYKSTEGDDEEFRFYWAGPQDHRTTEICEAVKAETHPKYGGSPVPMGELKRILLREARNHPEDGTPGRVEEFLPHWECRHTFVRDVKL